jgi:hypothetical protein
MDLVSLEEGLQNVKEVRLIRFSVSQHGFRVPVSNMAGKSGHWR